MKMKRFSAVLLILLMLVSCLSGCKSEKSGSSAVAGDYVEGAGDSAPTDQLIANQGTAEEDAELQPNDQNADSSVKDEADDDEQEDTQKPTDDGNKKPTDDGNKKPSTNGGSVDTDKPIDGTTDDDANGKEPEASDKGDEDQPEDEQEPEDVWADEEEEDPYADTPISKTPAKTKDGVSYFKENKLKVVSYNIRCADDPNGNSIEERAPRLMTVLNKYNPDLIGFQEYVVKWEEPTYFGLSDEYDYVLKYRSASNSEGTPIYYKKSKFKLLDEGHFWLSETPEKESKGWGADYWRICSWVKLQIRQTGEVVFFFNTHFDFKDEPQVNSAKLLIKQATDICKGEPMIVSADYNMTWSSKGYAEMTKFFTDVNTERDETKTYSGYRDPASSLIDFIFVTGKTIKPVKYNVMNEKPGGKFVSDHFGVYSEVIIL